VGLRWRYAAAVGGFVPYGLASRGWVMTPASTQIDLYSMINGLFQDGLYKQGADG
jgi:hypothetical protein